MNPNLGKISLEHITKEKVTRKKSPHGKNRPWAKKNTQCGM